jgi:hypothetical protein
MRRCMSVQVSLLWGAISCDVCVVFGTNVSLTDIDILSTSAIHQGVPHVDFSLKIDVGQHGVDDN